MILQEDIDRYTILQKEIEEELCSLLGSRHRDCIVERAGQGALFYTRKGLRIRNECPGSLGVTLFKELPLAERLEWTDAIIELHTKAISYTEQMHKDLASTINRFDNLLHGEGVTLE